MLRDPDVIPRLRHHVGPLDIGCKDQYQQFQVGGVRFAFRLPEITDDPLAQIGLRALVHDPLAHTALKRAYADDPTLSAVPALAALGFVSEFVRVARRRVARPSPLEALRIGA
jgi:hypothetical protein